VPARAPDPAAIIEAAPGRYVRERLDNRAAEQSRSSCAA
jgi:hypothetical protein